MSTFNSHKSDAIRLITNHNGVREDLSLKVLNSIKQHLKQQNSNGLAHDVSSKIESGLINILQDDNCKKDVLGTIENLINPSINSLFPSANAAVSQEIAKIGLETLMVEFKVFNLNQETQAIKKLNELAVSELAANMQIYAEELRASIQKNKENHEDVKVVLQNNSLDGLHEAAKLINPNANDYNKNIDQEIEDFLNGGDLIL